jgi:cell division septation protein DedD
VTTKDKTGDQLMASIRKTKTEGATADKEPAAVPQKAATPKAATPKAKPATAKRPHTVKKKVVPEPRTKKTGPAAQGAAYQSSGRVWPD